MRLSGSVLSKRPRKSAMLSAMVLVLVLVFILVFFGLGFVSAITPCFERVNGYGHLLCYMPFATKSGGFSGLSVLSAFC